jgi:hypothetical protein
LHEEKTYPTSAFTGKTWQIYSHKLSIISKKSKLMHIEMRYQAKIYAISDMPRKEKFPAFSPPIFFLK